MFCRNCGGEMPESASVCARCGFYAGGQPVSAVHAQRGGNGLSIGGFVCAVASFLVPVPVVNTILAIVGVVLSTVSLTQNRPLKGLAIAGVVIGVFATIGTLAILITEPEFYREIWEM